MTLQEIVDAALARAMEFSQNVPNTFSVSQARVQAHQEQLFGTIADINREYSGRNAIVTLTAGQGDLSGMDPLPMRIVRVLVEDPGTTAYVLGQKVNVVPVDDLNSALAPRATLRDGILDGVSGELTAVVSVRVYYAKRPAALTDGNVIPDLPAQYHELLVIDLAKQMVRKTIGLNQSSRDDIIQVLQAEYEEIAADFIAHLRNYNFAETSRHGRTARPS